jgi:hypothetical protein
MYLNQSYQKHQNQDSQNNLLLLQDPKQECLWLRLVVVEI